MVVSAHPLATEAGVSILRQGGNAFDAAIAVNYALAVVYPRAGNITGGGFMVAMDSSGTASFLDFRETAPASAHRDMFLDGDGEPVDSLSLFGALSSGVPGTVAGMQAIYGRYGSLPFSSLLDYPAKLANAGVSVSEGEAQNYRKYLPCIQRFSSHAGPFENSGKPWETGDVLQQPALASTLMQIGESGSGEFYKGKLASILVSAIQKAGGIISQDDLSNYRPVWRDPLEFEVMGYRIYAPGPPSSGGIALQQMLTMLHMLRIDTTDYQDFDFALKLIEVSRIAYADRSYYSGDPDFVEIPVDIITDREYLKHRLNEINFDHAIQSADWGPGSLHYESEETTHFTIADRYGNVVSVTTTLNSNFGSCMYIPELGIFMNNQMDDFSKKPGVPNQFGLIGQEANSIEPGKRMLSSMTPVIITRDDEFFAALGTPGGSTIITSVMQVFLNAAVLGQSPEMAVQWPRFHYQWLPDTVYYELGALSAVADQLEAHGYALKQRQPIGRVEAVFRLPDGKLIGVADARGEDHASGL